MRNVSVPGIDSGSPESREPLIGQKSLFGSLPESSEPVAYHDSGAFERSGSKPKGIHGRGGMLSKRRSDRAINQDRVVATLREAAERSEPRSDDCDIPMGESEYASRPLPLTKRPIGISVLAAARERISKAFDECTRVYVSFSAGKDSTVMLHLVAEEARKRGRSFGVLLIDLEAQYTLTINHAEECRDMYSDCSERT